MFCFTGEPYEVTRHPHIQEWHSFICLPMQMLRVTVEAGWLQCSISAWHERFSVGVWRTGTHITALWARQPLSNYCEPSQALLRHALNFAQDRWGPLNMQQSQAFPLLTAAACVDNVIPVAPEASYWAKNGYQQLAGKKFSFMSCIHFLWSGLCYMLSIRGRGHCVYDIKSPS